MYRTATMRNPHISASLGWWKVYPARPAAVREGAWSLVRGGGPGRRQRLRQRADLRDVSELTRPLIRLRVGRLPPTMAVLSTSGPLRPPRRATPRHARRLPRSVAITTDYGNGYRTPPISSTQRSTPRVTATCSSWATAASARGSTRCRKRTSRSGPGSASSSDRPVRVDQAARPSSHFCHASVSVEGSRSSK